MKTSKTGIALIKRLEMSFNGGVLFTHPDGILVPYRNSHGVWAIGYGSTFTQSGPVTEQTIMTKEGAEKVLLLDLTAIESVVETSVGGLVNQNMFDALVSYANSSESHGFRSSKLVQLIRQLDYFGAAEELRLGRCCCGCPGRREQEARLFCKPLN